MRYVDDGIPVPDLEATRRILERAMASQQELGISLWPVMEKSSQRLIGCCGFHRFQGGPALEIAYHFAASSWGHGYASEAVAACLVHAHESLGAPRVVGMIHPENSASRRVLEKCGFREAGAHEGEVLFEWIGSPGELAAAK